MTRFTKPIRELLTCARRVLALNANECPYNDDELEELGLVRVSELNTVRQHLTETRIEARARNQELVTESEELYIEKNELATKLASREAMLQDATNTANKLIDQLDWLTRWREHGEVPCPFPGDSTVMYRDVDAPLETAFASCYSDSIPDNALWRPTADCLKYWEGFKDV